MTGENGTPETPDWSIPERPIAEAYEAPAIPPNVTVGEN